LEEKNGSMSSGVKFSISKPAVESRYGQRRTQDKDFNLRNAILGRMKAAIFEKTGLENLSESKFWIWIAIKSIWHSR
jgi:hypothetical protein